MAGLRDEDDGEKPACRCLDAARYAVSTVVMVLIVAITAKAIKLVLRPDELALSVAGSSVYTRRFPSSSSSSRLDDDGKLMFVFNLHAANPSGRVCMYYLNITAYLFDDTCRTPATESSSPRDDSLVFFELGDMAVVQMEYEDKIKASTIGRDPEHISLPFFDALMNRQEGGSSSIRDATMRVDGILVTETSSRHNTTPQPTTYYCRQLTIVGLNPEGEQAAAASMSSQAATCTTSP